MPLASVCLFVQENLLKFGIGVRVDMDKNPPEKREGRYLVVQIEYLNAVDVLSAAFVLYVQNAG